MPENSINKIFISKLNYSVTINLKKKELIEKLKKKAPLIIERTLSHDMGHEFCAIVPDGIIFPEVGMLLNYSGCSWPPDEWEDKTEKDYELLLYDIHPTLNLLGFIIGLPLFVGVVLFTQASISYFVL